jgi:hypothetical protein
LTQLYGLLKTETLLFKSSIVDMSLNQAEQLQTISNLTSSFVANKFGGIQCSNLEVKKVGDRFFSSQNYNLKLTASNLPAVPLISNSSEKPTNSNTAITAPAVVSDTIKNN